MLPRIKEFILPIDQDLVKPKIAYFMYIGALGAIYPILTLWFAYVGMSPTRTGVLFSFRPFISFVALPLAGMIADKWKVHKILLIGICIASTTFRLLMLVDTQFVWITVFFMLTEVTGTPVGSLLDAGVVALLGPERRTLYGKQRLWGSLGYGLVALLIGFLVESLNNDMNWYFYVHTMFIVIAVVVFSLMPNSPVTPPVPIWNSVNLIFSSIQSFAFFLLMVIIGIGQGSIGAYFFLFLQQLHADAIVFGVATAISCFSELPFFFFSGWLLAKLGERNILYIACIGGIIRTTWYTIPTNPWWIIPAESMHGIYFGAMWAASMSYVHKIAPPGLGATAQGLLGGLYSGLGNGIGSLIGGMIFDKYGYIVLFRSVGIMLTVTLLGFAALQLFAKKDTALQHHEMEGQELEDNIKPSNPSDSSQIEFQSQYAQQESNGRGLESNHVDLEESESPYTSSTSGTPEKDNLEMVELDLSLDERK